MHIIFCADNVTCDPLDKNVLLIFLGGAGVGKDHGNTIFFRPIQSYIPMWTSRKRIKFEWISFILHMTAIWLLAHSNWTSNTPYRQVDANI